MWLKRTWYDEHRVRSETVVAEADGGPSSAACGPHREFDIDGRPVREVLIASGRVLSIDEYRAARDADHRLPSPTLPPPTPEEYRQFRAALDSDPRYVALRRSDSDRFCTDLLERADAATLPARAARGCRIFVGQRSRRRSDAILRTPAEAPCNNVYAVVLQTEELPGDDVGLAVGAFVLGVPLAPADRGAVWQTARASVQSAGYVLDADIGQRFMFLKIK